MRRVHVIPSIRYDASAVLEHLAADRPLLGLERVGGLLEEVPKHPLARRRLVGGGGGLERLDEVLEERVRHLARPDVEAVEELSDRLVARLRLAGVHRRLDALLPELGLGLRLARGDRLGNLLVRPLDRQRLALLDLLSQKRLLEREELRGVVGALVTEVLLDARGAAAELDPAEVALHLRRRVVLLENLDRSPDSAFAGGRLCRSLADAATASDAGWPGLLQPKLLLRRRLGRRGALWAGGGEH